jgi:hypothetical protein
VVLTDPVFTLNYLFLLGPAPPCPDAADANDSGRIDLADVMFTLNFLFLNGPDPPPPGPNAPGPDPTADRLPECSGSPCN